ncbi:MAG TPA: NusG domain II-containing protein [bacterium]|nr:NusG domain II-containing protein [bacterium]HPP87049.1 NusG domain II-containing protein [bacterium]
MKTTIIDWLIIVIIGIILLFFLFSDKISKNKDDKKKFLLISSDNFNLKYDISQDTELIIAGKLGNSKIKIKKREAFFADSPCKNKLCVHSKPIADEKQINACLPNGILIKIIAENYKDNKKSENIDATTK